MAGGVVRMGPWVGSLPMVVGPVDCPVPSLPIEAGAMEAGSVEAGSTA